MVDEVEQAAVGPLEVLEQQDRRAPGGDPLEEGSPRPEQRVAPARRRGLEAEQGEERRLDPAPVVGVGHEVGHRLGDPSPGRRLVVSLGQAGPPADHLAERPERDSVAVGGRPAAMPVDVVDEAVDVLLELPGEPALADPARPRHRDEARPPVASGRTEHVLEQAELLVPSDERRLGQVRPTLATALGDDPQRAPGGDGGALALERLVADRLERDRRRRRPMGRVADEHPAGQGDRLEARGGVDQVAGDHALVRRAERDRGLAGQDAGARLDPRPEAPDRVDQLEPGPDGPLRVVLLRGRGAPDGHHRVADELLDRPAVAPDDVAGELEVAGQRVADVLGVALLGERREPDQVGEQDRHEPSLGGRTRTGPSRPRAVGAGRSAGCHRDGRGCAGLER